MDDAKKLLRPTQGRMIAGVCAGIARHFGLDASLVRVIWALCICLFGTGFLAYLICWIIIPDEQTAS